MDQEIKLLFDLLYIISKTELELLHSISIISKTAPVTFDEGSKNTDSDITELELLSGKTTFRL